MWYLQYYDTKYTKELMKLEEYLGKEAEELNRVIKEIDDLQKEENVVFKELHGKRRWEWSDVYEVPTKFYVGFTIIQIIIMCCFLINTHMMYFFQTMLVCFITTFIVVLFTSIGYQIFGKSMYKAETKRLEGLKKREKDISEKVRSLYKLKDELEIKVMNNKANADLVELDYDKEKYEDILKFLKNCVDAKFAYEHPTDRYDNRNKFKGKENFAYTVLNTEIRYFPYVHRFDTVLDTESYINQYVKKYSFHNNGYQYLRNISECSMLSVILRKEIEKYIRKKYADELVEFTIYENRFPVCMVYNDFGCDASGKISFSGEGVKSIVVNFSMIRLNKYYKDQSTMKSIF